MQIDGTSAIHLFTLQQHNQMTPINRLPALPSLPFAKKISIVSQPEFSDEIREKSRTLPGLNGAVSAPVLFAELGLAQQVGDLAAVAEMRACCPLLCQDACGSHEGIHPGGQLLPVQFSAEDADELFV